MLDPRKSMVLAMAVERYIQSSEPVGSKYIAEEIGSISSATIRNDMAALEAIGLLEQPHASAGRVPTQLGYRVYIDQLMQPKPLSLAQKQAIDALFNVRNADPDRLLSDATKAISALTGLGGFSTTIMKQTVTVKKITITPADNRTLMIAMIASNGVIKNKVCRVDFDVNQAMVEAFAKFANARMVAQSLDQISQNYLSAVSVDLGSYSMVFNPILGCIYELAKEINDGQYFLQGTTRLLQYNEIDGQAYELLAYLERPNEITKIIGDGITHTWAIVGRESQTPELTKCSVLVSRYQIGKSATGLIGVVGPTRVDYSSILPQLEYFANTLGKLLTDTYTEDPLG